MGLFSRFEHKAEDIIEGSGGRGKGGIEPVKLAKRAYKEMQREKMVGVGHEYAPTLFNVLVSPEDDAQMAGYYPSLAGEIETYLSGRAKSAGLVFDCPPLVRFIVDDGLKKGRFDIIAENVSASIIADLRKEEMEHYGIAQDDGFGAPVADAGFDSAFEPSYEQPYEAPVQPQPEPEPVGYSAIKPTPEPARQPEPAPVPQPAQAAEFSSEQIPEEYVYVPEPEFADPPAPQASASHAGQAPARNYPPTELEQPVVPVQQSAHVPAAAPAASAAPAVSAAPTQLIDAAPVQVKPQAALFEYATQTRHPLIGARIVLGRGSNCDCIISEPSVSRHHAELLRDASGWLIRDTGSTNGTTVNGSRASQSRIYDGDIIALGTAELEFQEG